MRKSEKKYPCPQCRYPCYLELIGSTARWPDHTPQVGGPKCSRSGTRALYRESM